MPSLPRDLLASGALNVAHTAGSLAAFCAGLDTVKAMMDDATVRAYLNRVMFAEIVPCVPRGPPTGRTRRRWWPRCWPTPGCGARI